MSATESNETLVITGPAAALKGLWAAAWRGDFDEVVGRAALKRAIAGADIIAGGAQLSLAKEEGKALAEAIKGLPKAKGLEVALGKPAPFAKRGDLVHLEMANGPAAPAIVAWTSKRKGMYVVGAGRGHQLRPYDTETRIVAIQPHPERRMKPLNQLLDLAAKLPSRLVAEAPTNTEASSGATYRYGLTRPVDAVSVPPGHVAMEPPAYEGGSRLAPYGVVSYDRALSGAEIEAGKLAPLLAREKQTELAERVAQEMSHYAAEYAELGRDDPEAFDGAVREYLQRLFPYGVATGGNDAFTDKVLRWLEDVEPAPAGAARSHREGPRLGS